MGSQTNLLILLGGILVVISIFVGITMFRANMTENDRDQIRNELSYLSKEALSYYYRPTIFGGGGKSFRSFNGTRRMKISTKRRRPIKNGARLWESDNAVYAVVVAADDSVVIEATGDDLGNDGNNVMRLWGVVKVDDFYTKDLN
jgi:hypothetical protein